MKRKEITQSEFYLACGKVHPPTHPPTCDATEKENDGCERPDELLQKNFVRKLIKEI